MKPYINCASIPRILTIVHSFFFLYKAKNYSLKIIIVTIPAINEKIVFTFFDRNQIKVTLT